MSIFTLETYLFERKAAFCNFLNSISNKKYKFHFHSIHEAIYMNLMLLSYSNRENRKFIVFPQKHLSRIISLNEPFPPLLLLNI